MSFSLVSQFFMVVALAFVLQSNAFVMQQSTRQSSTELAATSRRSILCGLVAGATIMATATLPAEATYSAYANREKDWEMRQKNGEVKYSSSKSLKAQLKEIVPMNSEGSKIFCPNGPSANVSPLMENKCGDALALPSVYGRTEDAVGNSIPGFSGGRYPSSMVGNGPSGINDLGEFPAYQRDVRK